MVNIKIVKGDITESTTDAIINTSNDMLILGSGLGGAIRAKGGDEILNELSRYGQVNMGEAVITGGGNLKSRYIIHVALNRFDEPVDIDYIEPSLINAFNLASKYGIKSIAIPDMSVGIVRVSPHKAAEKVFSAIKRFIEDNKSTTLEEIEVVLWDIDSLYIYRDVYREIFEQF